jgi:4-amino-4-deoxy-L-arabinose transferase-like glycosyltransferase
VAAGWARPERAVLGLTLLLTLGLGVAYAVQTPAWQAPDEPAHYNYAAQLAEHPGTLPRLAPGDYSREQIELLTRLRFPKGLSVDGLRYEDYQPPLYYYMAALAYAAGGPGTDGRLLAIRLLGAFLGVCTAALAWQIARMTVPGDAALALGSAAFVGLLPMRLAIASSANNDALAHPVAAGLLLVGVLRATGRLDGRRYALLGGAASAAAVLTKVTLYPLIAVLAMAELLRWPTTAALARRLRESLRTLLGLAAAPAVVAVAWCARNVAVYGRWDLLGTQAHDRIVAGQPRTADWIAQYGLQAWASRFAAFTFDSFWGVFGWMGVFLDRRLYAALFLATVVAGMGLALYLVRLRHRQARSAPGERRAVGLLSLAVLVTILLYLAYNVGYVQHQGRYLLVALPALGLFYNLGLREGAWRLAGLAPARLPPVATERAALAAFSLALAVLAWVALVRAVVPGLG